ncbi:hypothetical protein IPH92_01820 [Candidatus Kaiserbacteria bacterium]|nr:MAG: hypothetical protein IPH92_01820 [Candidatus Kaiserbacteria bacterium]
MKRYYDDFTFSPAQAAHASSVVLNLIVNRRFFLHPQENGHGLDPVIFRKEIALDAAHRLSHINARNTAVGIIKSAEELLGIIPPDLSDNRQLVVYNRYGGGFDICRVYPLSVFSAVAPRTIEDLVEDVFVSLLQNQNIDDIPPRTQRKKREIAAVVATRIWSEFMMLDLFNPLNERSVVMMGAKVPCSYSAHLSNDFTGDIVPEMQDTSFALGYLFWKFSQKTRVVDHGYVVFSTSIESHVRVRHWKETSEYGGKPFITYRATNGYSAPVLFVTAL